jgi:anti-sigma B factor antagonist
MRYLLSILRELSMAPAFGYTPQRPKVRPLYRVTVHADSDAEPAIVVVSGEIDLACADSIGAVLHDQLRRGRRYVRIDLTAVTFLDATALGMLLSAHHQFLAEHGTLTLTGLGRAATRLLHITGLDEVLFVVVAGARPRFATSTRSTAGSGLRSVAV